MANDDSLSKNEERQARIERALKRKKKRALFALGVGIIIIALLMWFGIWRSGKDINVKLGEEYPDDGQKHISLQEGDPSAYSSHPPSSGPHYGSPANWGIYDYEVNDLIFIHNLEHGGIWIAYNPLLPSPVIGELTDIVNGFGGVKIVMAPRQKKAEDDKDVAVIAWRRVYKFNMEGRGALTSEEKDTIRAFYKRFVNRGPESVPATMPGIDPKSLIFKL